MSIENEFKRIADALERLADLTEKRMLTVKIDNPVSLAGQRPADPPAVPTGDIEVTDLRATQVNTPEDLRNLAMKYLDAAGQGTETEKALADHIREVVCKKFNPKMPKLAQIPADSVKKAAQMIVTKAQELKLVLKD
jgi:hypothetical protein